MVWLTIQQLKSQDPERRRKAVERLGEMQNPKALPTLAKATADSDPLVRIAAVVALGLLGGEQAMEAILRAWSDRSGEVRLAVITQLKENLSDRATSVLVSALRDSDAIVRARAARLLELRGWHPVEVEDEVWLAIARGKLSQAATSGAVAIRPLESILQDASAGSLHIAAVEALGTIPDERVMKCLVRCLRSTDQTVVTTAIGALVNAGGSEVVNDLAPLLKHKNNQIRSDAVDALARFDASRWAEDFRTLLRDQTWDVRCAAANALAKSPEAATVDALILTLKDQYEDVRAAAASSLGRIKDARAIGPLVLALKDPGTNVRRFAAASLAQIDPNWTESEAARNMIPDLRSSLASGDWMVRSAAATALKQLGADSGGAMGAAGKEMATPGRRRQAVVLGAFTALLQDTDPDLRLAAAVSLGQLRDQQARSPLMTALSDTDALVRHAATEALLNLGVE
jgi:HEAT repeat protein